MSACVQALPSLHAVPLGLAGFEQAPVAGSQVPAVWHWSLAVQTTPAHRSRGVFVAVLVGICVGVLVATTDGG